MEKIKILKEEVEILENELRKKNFMKLINTEKMDIINDQLEIIRKKLEITNILLENEKENRFIQNIIGRPPSKDTEKQKSIVDMIVSNREYISPTILGIYGKNIDNIEKDKIETSSSNSKKDSENKAQVEELDVDVKVNIDQYLDNENDSDYEDKIIKKLKGLEINEELEINNTDIKPNIPPPVVVPPGQSSNSEPKIEQDWDWKNSTRQDRRWKVNDEEQRYPPRKYIDRRQYYLRKTNDYIPMKYVPYDKEPQALNPNGIYLDLDCVEDREKMLNTWIKENSAVVSKEGMTKDQGIEFLRRTMRGSVERYIESLGDSYETLKNESETTIKFLSNLETLIRIEFLGYDREKNDSIVDKEHAIRGMMNISICNMCYFDQYTCEYTDLFYKARLKEASSEYDFYSKMYMEKLPEPFRTRVIRDFNTFVSGYNDPTKITTLGTKIYFVKKKLTDYCIEAKEQNQIYKYQKRQLCCPKNNEIGQYGCHKPYKKRKKWNFRKINFKRYNKRNRYFRKKDKYYESNRNYKRNRTNKEKLGEPKKCTCFICKEQGHYANECPKRSKQNIKLLAEVDNYGFEPIESDIESEYSIYSASINSEDFSDNE